jgi:hypothetical protein
VAWQDDGAGQVRLTLTQPGVHTLVGLDLDP